MGGLSQILWQMYIVEGLNCLDILKWRCCNYWGFWFMDNSKSGVVSEFGKQGCVILYIRLITYDFFHINRIVSN